MRQAFAIIGTIFLLACPAIAQQPGAIDGAWVGHFTAPTGVKVKAELTVRGGEGTWRSYVPQTQMRVNQCVERPNPVAIAEPTPGQFKLVIQASKVLSGCQDAHATVQLIDSSTLEGKFADGRNLTLKRK